MLKIERRIGEMKKKIAVVFTSLLMLTVLLTTPYFTPSATAPDGEVKHWKIVLATKNCYANITGSLSYPNGSAMPGTSFALTCNCSGFVFAKVKNETANVHDINFTKWVSWDKDATWEENAVPVSGLLKKPAEEHNTTWYQHEQINATTNGMVVVEVHEQPYDEDRPYFEWQITLFAQNSTKQPMTALLKGNLTLDGTPIPGTNFTILVGPDYKPPEPPPIGYHHHRALACVVVQTEWCTVPNDIHYTLEVPDMGIAIIDEEDDITQFPWVYENETEDGSVMVEVTEVQMHRYVLMLGETDAYGQLSDSPPWLAGDSGVPAFDRLAAVWKLENTTVVNLASPNCTDWHGVEPSAIECNPYHLTCYDTNKDGVLSAGDWAELTNATHKIESVVREVEYGAITNMTIAEPYFDPFTGQQLPGMGVPFATRPPDLTPLTTDKFPQKTYGHNITFTQKDPITGIVKLSIPAESYAGLDHPYYSSRLLTYFRVQILLEDQGCGWLFTGEGKDPVLGDVDIITFNNSTGVYSNRTGERMDIYPCLQELKGDDGIPGTGDDPFGDGEEDPPGSCIVLIPSRQVVLFWQKEPFNRWALLFESPWPQPFTTGTASDIVVEAGDAPNNELALRHANKTVHGEPMEFLAGIDHKAEGWNVTWKHPYCNAYFTTACAWSMIDTDTVLGILDVMFYSVQKAYRYDALIADINCDEKANIKDIGRVGKAFGATPQDFGPDGIPYTDDDKTVDDPNWDAGADLIKPRAKINIKDIGRIGKDFGAKLTPDGIIRK